VHYIPRHGQESTPFGVGFDCGHGVLSWRNTVDQSEELWKSRSHEVSIQGILAFACGLSIFTLPRSLYLAISSRATCHCLVAFNWLPRQQLHLYALFRRDSPNLPKVVLWTVARPSQELSSEALSRTNHLKGYGQGPRSCLSFYRSLHPLCDIFAVFQVSTLFSRR
jgi:hypothetical protein